MANASTRPSGAGIPLALGVICLLILGISACDRKSDKPPQGSQAAKEVGPKAFKGEVYRTVDGSEVVTITSPTELELRKGGDNFICEYTRQDDGLRVVVTVFGTKTAEYFSTINEGLKHNNVLLYDVQHYQDYQAAQSTSAPTLGAVRAALEHTATPENSPGNDTFRLVVPVLATPVKQGEVQTVLVLVDRGEAFKQDVKLEFKAPNGSGLNVEATSTTVRKDVRSDVFLKITAATDAPVGESKILMKGTPDKGQSAETEFKVSVIAK